MHQPLETDDREDHARIEGSTALIGLGSNLGDREAILDGAVVALSETPGLRVRVVSAYLETSPAGGPPGQGPFLNAAAALDSTIDPFELHQVLQRIERRAGRIRSVRWGERSLDLDLLLFGDRVIDTAELTIPHPRMAVRRFVLAPLAEVAPRAIDPLTGHSIADLLANLDRRPNYVALDLPRSTARPLFRRLLGTLKAVGPSAGDAPLFGNVLPSAPEPLRASEPAAILKARTQELRADRWSAEIWGDRWLVTEFWLDRLYLDLVGSRGPTQLDGFRESFLKSRSRTIRPTLVVAPPLPPGGLASWTRAIALDRPIGSDVPILRPGSSDPKALLAEVLAACAASRP